MSGGLPNVAVHDLVIHTRDKELVVGTHGRSFYVADVQHLQQMNPDISTKQLHAFEIKKKFWSSRWGSSWSQWAKPSVPELSIPYFASKPGNMMITVKAKDGKTLKNITHKTEKGLNYFVYDCSVEASAVKAYEKALNAEHKEGKKITVKKAKNGEHYLMPGEYVVELFKDGVTEKVIFLVERRK